MSPTPATRNTHLFLVVLFVVIVGCVWFGIRWMHTQTAKVARTFSLPPSMSFTGFDPLAAVPYIQQQLGGDQQLLSIQAPVVKRDGTVDLTQNSVPHPTVTYQFFSGASSSVPSAYGLLSSVGTQTHVEAYEQGRVASISQKSATVSFQFRLTNKGFMAFFNPDTSISATTHFVSAPQCSTAALWAAIPSSTVLQADERGNLQYDSMGYTLLLPRVGGIYKFDEHCVLQSHLERKEGI